MNLKFFLILFSQMIYYWTVACCSRRFWNTVRSWCKSLIKKESIEPYTKQSVKPSKVSVLSIDRSTKMTNSFRLHKFGDTLPYVTALNTGWRTWSWLIKHHNVMYSNYCSYLYKPPSLLLNCLKIASNNDSYHTLFIIFGESIFQFISQTD